MFGGAVLRTLAQSRRTFKGWIALRDKTEAVTVSGQERRHSVARCVLVEAG